MQLAWVLVFSRHSELLAGCLFRAGPDVSEEKAERAKKKEMVLEQVEEERERRVNQGEHVARWLKLVLESSMEVVLLANAPARAW